MSKTVCIISLTPVTDEPRVLRQSSALAKAGWNVIVAGFKGRQAPPDFWRFIEVAHVDGPDPWYWPIKRKFLRRMSKYSSDAAEQLYWMLAGYDGIFEHIAWVENVRCDLVVAHDYFTAPIAKKLADVSGCKYVVDCHEYAYGQYVHDPEWVRNERPWIHSLQKYFLPKAAALTTVSAGIADELAKDYALATRPTVIRSVPFYRDLPVRPVGEHISVLYHGVLSPIRGLEECIASMPLCRDGYRLIIRGPGPDDYIAHLHALIAEHGVADRVFIEPPVLFNDMVPRANEADIGIFTQENLSSQKCFTLPNKFFEYVMARTCLAVADLPEMAALVREHKLGVLIPTSTPQDIANTLNRLDRQTIYEFKKSSDKAAKMLNWEAEGAHMVTLYENVLKGQ